MRNFLSNLITSLLQAALLF